MWIVKLHQLSTILCGFFRHLSKSVILSLSKSYICSNEINCISLCNEFGTNVFCSFVERKVKTVNHLSTFAVVGVVNTEIFISFIKLSFYKHTRKSQQFNILFFGNIFLGPHTGQPVWNLLWIWSWIFPCIHKSWPCFYRILKSTNEMTKVAWVSQLLKAYIVQSVFFPL